ncbi:MFS transporter [Streptomyces sp. NPDC051569]|uniref:MFS transporter n=1 Tax=Streptomyces sp. NPDC051569 TaxID=3365661 RepID=UPI0037B121E3
MNDAQAMKTPSSSALRPAWVTLLLISVGIFLLPVGLTGAGVALPDIAKELHPSPQALSWVVSGYNVMFASLMLAFGTLADRFGRRRIFQLGMLLFTIGAILCVVANSIVLLDIARFINGIGAGAALTAGSTLLAARFEGAARVRAFGVFGTALGAGLAFGPLISGLLLTGMGWRGVFAIPAVIGLLVTLFSPLLAESKNPDAKRLDWPGTITFTGGLFLLIFALIEGPEFGWGSGAVIGSFIGAVVLMTIFYFAEKHQKNPMFDLALLRNGRFTGVSFAAASLAFTLLPLLVLLPTYFSAVEGYSALEAGAVLMFFTVPTLILPLLAPVLAKLFSVRAQLVTAMAMVAAGMAWLTVIAPHGGLGVIAGPLLLTGAGYGVTLAILDGAAVSSVELNRAGMAAGMFNAFRLSGDTAAAAVGASLLISVTSSQLIGKVADPQKVTDELNGGIHTTSLVAAEAFTSALHVVIWISAGLAAVTVPLLFRALRPERNNGGKGRTVARGNTSEARPEGALQ